MCQTCRHQTRVVAIRCVGSDYLILAFMLYRIIVQSATSCNKPMRPIVHLGMY